MDPVNLIPDDERRGDRAPMRTGATSYVLTGALALGVIMMIAMALTSKQISDGESDVQQLEQELAVATARAESLRAFTEFRTVQESRTTTIASLAQSRFDWERVLRELTLVLPSDAWLLTLSGTVSPSVQLEEGAEVQGRDSVPGPALEIIGCAVDQDAVAEFVAALEDIDGVTRVGLVSSAKADAASADASSDAGTGGAIVDCRTRPNFYQFEIVVAFDAVPTPAAAGATPGVPVAPGTDGALADSQAGTTAEQTAEAQEATNLIAGG